MNKTLAPQHWTERVRQIVFLIAYVVWFERATPLPFMQSRWGQIVYLGVLFYIGKGWVRWRQEQSPRFYARTQRWAASWHNRKFSLTDYTRYRITRIIRFLWVSFTIGWLIDGATEKCEGAYECAAAIPTLLVQNVQSLVEFGLRLAMSMFSIFGIMWLLARMDLHTTILPESIPTRFSDIYGQDKAVASVREALEILDKPDEVEALGGYMPAGILMDGPPGVGKSYLAQAAAGESGKPFVNLDASSFASMWVGVPIMKMKMLFKYLRKMSVKYGGVVVFFDEIDVLGSRGMGVANQILLRMFNKAVSENSITIGSGGGGALQMLLTEMSGMVKPKGVYNKIRVVLGFKPIQPPTYRILWMAATNMPGALDPALLRPGRFDRKLHMGYPDTVGRKVTFQGYLDKINHSLTDKQIETLARENPHATGASIKDAVNEGLLHAVREGRKVVSWEDMKSAIMSKMLGEEDGRMVLEEDRRRVALHEASHAVASHHYRPEAPIQFASVIKRRDTGGVVRAVDLEERFKLRSRLIADIKVSLASVWAEKFFFDDDLSTGPSSDLEKATRLALSMFNKYAMGDTVYVRSIVDDPTKDVYDENVENWLNELYGVLADEMYRWRDQVELVAQLLDKHGTVDGAEIHGLLGRMQ